MNTDIEGLGSDKAAFEGTLRFRLEENGGGIHSFSAPNSLLVPKLKYRVISPQHVAQSRNDQFRCVTDAHAVSLHWGCGRYTKTIPLHRSGNVALTRTAAGFTQYSAHLAQMTVQEPPAQHQCYPPAYVSDTETNSDHDEPDTPSDDDSDVHSHASREASTHGHEQSTNTNTQTQTKPTMIDFHDDEIGTPTQQPEKPLESDAMELLRWHKRLAHTSFHTLQRMATLGILPARLAKCTKPFCAACQYGKQTRRPWRTKPGTTPSLRTATRPGECVSVDQMESTTKGLIAQLKGILTKQRYRYATVFIDHYSRFSYVHLQQTLTSSETLEAKIAFEQYADSHGVRVEHYHADNGRFADNMWLDHLVEKRQSITYCGVGAHWQNRIAEKRIRDLTEATRTSLLDAKAKWRKAIHISLWPYTLRHANNTFNSVPSRKQRQPGNHTPLELFANTDVRPNVQQSHPFGCPAYVLGNKLQNQQSLRRWMPRSRLGINLGFSLLHARSVALILNPRTGLVSPQYHVKFDDLFETTTYARNTALDLREWQYKSYFKTRDGIDWPVLAPPKRRTPAKPSSSRKGHAPVPASVDQPASPQHVSFEGDDEGDNDEGLNGDPSAASEDEDESMSGTVHDEPPEPEPPPEPDPSLRRSGRTRRPSAKQREHISMHAAVEHEALATARSETQQFLCLAASKRQGSKQGGDPDTLSFRDAMQQPDRDRFITAMDEEIKTQEERKHWVLWRKKDVPKGHPICRGVWSMRRKRRILTGEVYKYKSRLTFDGSQQIEGVNYWNTYAPVVNAFTVRLFHTLALIRGWKARQIDFVLAYPQAPAPAELYMQIPRGYQLPPEYDETEYCLRLEKNIYGNKEGGRAWYLHLVAGLKKLGFEQSKIDHCVFYRGNVIFLSYVHDCAVYFRDDKDIEQLFHDLKQAGFDVSDEGEIADFLGVAHTVDEDGKLHLRQNKLLIQQILADMGYNERTKPKDKPAVVGKVLHRAEGKPPHAASWGFRSIIGKLNFLLSTRPDLSSATQNAARFSHNPRECHTKAVQQI